MSRTKYKRGNKPENEISFPLELPLDLRLNPVLFTTTTSDKALESMVFTFYPNAQGVSNLIKAIRQRCGVVVKYTDLDILSRQYVVTLINTAYLVQSATTKMLLPYDSFDMCFVIDMILKDGKDVSLDGYRLSPTKYEPHSAHDILLKKISWDELVRLENPAPCAVWDQKMMMVDKNSDTGENPREENGEINQPVQKIVEEAAVNESSPVNDDDASPRAKVSRTNEVVSPATNPANLQVTPNSANNGNRLTAADAAQPAVDFEEEGVNLSPKWESEDENEDETRERSRNLSITRERSEYSTDECQRVLNLVLKYDLSEFVVGNNLWKLFIKLELLHKNDPPRTFSSLQNMFRRKIMPDLEKSHGQGMYRCNAQDFKKYVRGRLAADRHNRATISEYGLKRRIEEVDRALLKPSRAK